MVSDNLLKAFKQRMRIDYDIDDENLREMLERSFNVIKSNCGEFDVESNEYGKLLVIEHARYAFNDDTEFFMSNFADDLASFAFSLRKEAILNGQKSSDI